MFHDNSGSGFTAILPFLSNGQCILSWFSLRKHADMVREIIFDSKVSQIKVFFCLFGKMLHDVTFLQQGVIMDARRYGLTDRDDFASPRNNYLGFHRMFLALSRVVFLLSLPPLGSL